MVNQCGLLSFSRPCRGLSLIGVVVAFPLVVYILLVAASGGRGSALHLYRDEQHVFTPQVGRCSHGERIAWAKTWNLTEGNHRDLLDDRFTIALSTVNKTKELRRTLDMLLSNRIPSLLEVVVIWNNHDEDMPKNYVSSHSVEVRYRKPSRNSPNEKLWNDPSYRTRAVLLSNDDVFYRPGDLEFVFDMWRRFGRDRVTGAIARCARIDPAGRWEYSLCRPGGRYAMVLTNLAFVDVSVLDAYNSEFGPIQKMRDHVDKSLNCEDIALNFVAAARLTVPDSRGVSMGGPLLVRGSEQYVNLDPLAGLRHLRGNSEARSECLNRFAEAFGCMPLVDEVARIEYGVKHNASYKALANKLRQ
ncbi:hypothetical protein V2A60_000817 [Cordyceps javanica]|uniref:EXTL2, alpha-1,4-N-acetylhexosaminyltransferase n=1 Tax=Cordyceps javanica TaxID=43265 RepID=A0A545VZM4_9HYPO|nr:EXTL2, alpha-1,4-N-acetylhexosaminyltransferase [Cordyceps javanica]TQW07163.1 EXTL2, alpha-1,4-N-acetylhexosaminyltransferase [Cordyceps javanica]